MMVAPSGVLNFPASGHSLHLVGHITTMVSDGQNHTSNNCPLGSQTPASSAFTAHICICPALPSVMQCRKPLFISSSSLTPHHIAQEPEVTEADIQPAKPLWHEDRPGFGGNNNYSNRTDLPAGQSNGHHPHHHHHPAAHLSAAGHRMLQHSLQPAAMGHPPRGPGQQGPYGPPPGLHAHPQQPQQHYPPQQHVVGEV